MICPFSKYSNIFGKINTGVHSYRLCNVAMVDYIMTIIISLITTCVTKIPIIITTIFWLIMSFICHVLFGVQTSTVKWLGITC